MSKPRMRGAAAAHRARQKPENVDGRSLASSEAPAPAIGALPLLPRLDAYASPSSFWMPEYIDGSSAWIEHAPFAFWLVGALRPRTFVELGTHGGYSYFSFCQATKLCGLDTRCYAIDHWQGDEHAGFYGEEIFQRVSSYNDKHYAAFSRLVRSTFDEALPHFSDTSIDLLHIDGRHLYEDVKHDFESWRPKLSERSMVLFHDINVRDRDFGVSRFWEDIKAGFPSFEFLHTHGLGVLGYGAALPQNIRVFFEATAGSNSVVEVRGVYSALGAAVRADLTQRETSAALQATLAERDLRVETLSGTVTEREREIESLTATVAEGGDRIGRLTRTAASEAAAARARIDKQAAEIERLRTALAERDHEAEGLRQDWSAAEDRNAVLEKTARTLETDLDSTRSGLASTQQELRSVLGSTAWLATWPLRSAGRRLPPRLRRAVRGSAKLAWWAARLQLREKLAERRRTRSQIEAVVAPECFNPAARPEQEPDIARGAETPDDFLGSFSKLLQSRRIEHAEHTLRTAQRRFPEHREIGQLCRKLTATRALHRVGLFDPDVYRRMHDDLNNENIDPWVHFVTFGLDEGRHFTSCEVVAKVLNHIRHEVAEAGRLFKANAEQALATAEFDSPAAALMRQKGVKVGIYCSNEGNFFMQEIANLLTWGMQDQRINVAQRDENADFDEPFDLRIFVAPQEFFNLGRGKSWMGVFDRPNTVLFNVDQVQSSWFCGAFPLLSRAALVLDINFQSAAILRQAGCNAIHVMPGYLSQSPYVQPCEEISAIEIFRGYDFARSSYNWRTRDLLCDRLIDVLFIGTQLARRDRTLARLQSLSDAHRFVCITTPEQAPMTARNHRTTSTEINCALGQRAKIVLNIHRDWLGYFEWSRMVLQGFWQGACVVSDPCLPHPIFKAGTHFLEESTRHVGELIRWLLETDEGRAELDRVRAAGYRTATTLGSMRVSLQPALDAFASLLAIAPRAANGEAARLPSPARVGATSFVDAA